MTSALQRQLAAIAASSTHQLDLKAQKTAHGKSLLFEPKVAAHQSFDTIYQICIEGFQELCALDGRFVPFSQTLFSEQSKAEDRTQMTQKENEELDSVLENFLTLAGPRLLLRPAVKAVEWLVRRFRVHEYNTECLVITWLPYHATPSFPTLLSVLPTNLGPSYRFLAPYIPPLANPPRQTIVYTAANTLAFFSAFQTYILKCLKAGHQSSVFLSFWAGLTTQALDAMLESAHSGRREIQAQREEEVILRILPVLNECLQYSAVSEAILGCYMIITVLVTKAAFEDKILNALMNAIVSSHTPETLDDCLVCLAVVAEERTTATLPVPVTRHLLKIQNLPQKLITLAERCRVERLALGCILGAIEHIGTLSGNGNVDVVEAFLTSSLLDAHHTVLVMKAIIHASQNVGNSSENGLRSTAQLGELITRLNEEPGLSETLEKILKENGIDVEELEAKLRADIRPNRTIKSPVTKEEDIEMLDVDELPAGLPKPAPASLPQFTALSFLDHDDALLETVAGIFADTVLSRSDVEGLLRSPALGRSDAAREPLFLSFLARIWCGTHPATIRVAALRGATTAINGVEEQTDFQALIPYLLYALSDTHPPIRRAAAECTAAAAMSTGKVAKDPKATVWGSSNLYGKDSARIKLFSSADSYRVFSSVLVPILEECILDPSHMVEAVRGILNSSSHIKSPKAKGKSTELKSSQRSALVFFLSQHAVITPVLSVRLRLLSLLDSLGKIGTSARTDVILPAVRSWCSMFQEDAAARCSSEKLDLGHVDGQHLEAILPREMDGINLLTDILSGKVNSERWPVQEAAFRRLSSIWPTLRSEAKLPIATFLLQDALDESDSTGKFSQLRRTTSLEILRSVKLSSSVLESFIASIPDSVRMPDKPPSAKRRRTSRSEASRVEVQSPEDTAKLLRRLTLVLELVEASNPEEHTSLLKGLFNILGDLQQFKQQTGSSLVYLQSLVLGSLLPIVNKLRDTNETTEDKSAVRADLLVECIRHTSSPQVQNTALLLISGLASWVPELVLHNLMPVFTFMGSTLLRQSDDYSTHVVDQTISEVLPRLAASLRKRNKDFITGVADLLLSFTAAFEHIPPHRRLNLFYQLARTLGPEDSLAAILALLVDRYPTSDERQTLMSELLLRFNPSVVTLRAFENYLDLVIDSLKPKRTVSDVLFSFKEKQTPQIESSIFNLLDALADLVDSQKLRKRMRKSLETEIEATELLASFGKVFEKTVGVMQKTTSNTQLHGASSRLLTNCLNLLPTVDLVRSAESLLDNPDAYVRRAAMKAVNVKIAAVRQSDNVSIAALQSFLAKIEDIVLKSEDANLRSIAVTCVNQITEKFGKKDPLAIMSAARAVASSLTLELGDDDLQQASLLCLASVVEVVEDEFVSLLPDVLPKAFEYLRRSIASKGDEAALHNAVYALLSAIVQKIPFIFSGDYLEEALSISQISAVADLGEDCDEGRLEFVRAVARHIDPKELYGSLKKTWLSAAKQGPEALTEQLEILTVAIDSQPKSAVVKASQVLFGVFQTALDLRNTINQEDCQADYEPEEVDQLEEVTIGAAISMTLKLNDVTFRPFFVRLVEWASEPASKQNKLSKLRRSITFFSFLAVFFDRFKAIVTAYSSYILENGAQLLDTVSPTQEEGDRLCSSILRAFQKSFEHDQDGFWQAPAHFSPVLAPLFKQLTTHEPPTLTEEVIPAIGELAASAASPENHKDMNAILLKYMRSEEAHIRIAAIKCEHSLTRKLGEDWLGLLAEMLPIISELREDDDETVERETNRWIGIMEEVLGESLDPMLQ